MAELRKYACSMCARRKVKCDRQHPCSNCQKGRAECAYEAPPPPKPRKRAADEDLLARLAKYEELMKKSGVDYSQHANVWVESGLEAKREDDMTVEDAATELCLWSKLSHEAEPKQIFFYWQTFVECVNPLIKVVHVPSLQKRILEASWDVASIPKPLSALMFSIYLLSVTSLSSEACQSSSGEDRGALLTRYRTATVRALTAADFMTTKDLETLQATVLFTFSNPETELASTMTAIAIRVGQMMGLHKSDTDAKLSFFEKEMHIRLWWQIKGLDSRVRASSTPGIKLARSEFGDIRLPFNINDTDLHPDMLEPPVQHTGPTEMLCVLMKFEVTQWLRSSLKAAKVFDCIVPGFGRPGESTKAEDEAISELEAIYTEKYLSKLDRAVPFHDLTYTMAKLAIARMRFRLQHPRARAAPGDADVYMTKEDSDILFNAALSFLELVNVSIESKFSSQMFTHLTSLYQIDAWIYVISELRRRPSGPRITLAWKLVDNLYADHPELVDSVDNSLYTAFGNLTLEAWETRRKVLTDGKPVLACIELLWSKRRGQGDSEMAVSALDAWDFNVGDDLLDWNYWSDFVRF
ncbi:transcription factor [Fusarium coicis]|nr:transcription factor [Fusarium coicis]